MADLQCPTDNGSPSWGVLDLAMWKLVPERFSGGKAYIQGYKDAWVRHNRALIKSNAAKQRFPAELLAGVCWIEVGGDPSFIDSVAFNVRAFDWSGPDWVDRNMTITRQPWRTSFGPVSMQLGTAAHTMGLDAKTMPMAQLSALANCLQKDLFNIELVAQHLRQLIDQDGLQTRPPELSPDAVKVAGARYNRGQGLSLEDIRRNTSYGDFILGRWSRLTALL